MIGVVVIVALISGILYAVLGKSDVPVKEYKVGIRNAGFVASKKLLLYCSALIRIILGGCCPNPLCKDDE